MVAHREVTETKKVKNSRRKFSGSLFVVYIVTSLRKNYVLYPSKLLLLPGTT